MNDPTLRTIGWLLVVAGITIVLAAVVILGRRKVTAHEQRSAGQTFRRPLLQVILAVLVYFSATWTYEKVAVWRASVVIRRVTCEQAPRAEGSAVPANQDHLMADLIKGIEGYASAVAAAPPPRFATQGVRNDMLLAGAAFELRDFAIQLREEQVQGPSKSLWNVGHISADHCLLDMRLARQKLVIESLSQIAKDLFRSTGERIPVSLNPAIQCGWTAWKMPGGTLLELPRIGALGGKVGSLAPEMTLFLITSNQVAHSYVVKKTGAAHTRVFKQLVVQMFHWPSNRFLTQREFGAHPSPEIYISAQQASTGRSEESVAREVADWISSLLYLGCSAEHGRR
jgi:hypothetical protein